MLCTRTQHQNNVPRVRGEKHDISLKILHQAGFETARQTATSAERYALTMFLSITMEIRGFFNFKNIIGPNVLAGIDFGHF